MPLVEHSVVIEELDSHLEPIRDSMIRGWKMWEELPSKSRVALSASARATVVHDFIVDCASELHVNAKIYDISGLKLFVFNGKFSLRYKKFDDSLSSRNQPTQQVKDFRGQQQLDGVSALYNLEAGYVLDGLGQNINSLHVVCPNGKSNYWELELLENGVVTGSLDIFSEINEDYDINSEPVRYRTKKDGVIIPFNRKND